MKRPQRLLLLLVWTVGLLVPLWPRAARAAVNFNYDTDVTYHINADDSVLVAQNYTVTNHTSRFYLTELKLTTPNDALANLHVNYSDGASIPATTVQKSGTSGGIKYNYQEIDITFPRQTYGLGRQWSFKLSYQATGLVETKGSSHTVFVPTVEAGDTGDDYKATVDVPRSFGNPHFTGAQAASSGAVGDRQLYQFTKDDLTRSALALAFGDSTIYQLNFNFPLRNDLPIPRTMTVTLPPDLNNQRSYINKLTPAPSNLRLDSDGNVLADFTVPARSTVSISTDVSGEVKYLDYALDQSGKQSDIPADLVAKYTKPSHFWTTSGGVGDAAAKLNDSNAPTINNVKAMYQFVIDKLSYNKDKIKFNIRQGSAQALAHPDNAVCLEYADLLIAMLRSQKIPARMAVGYGFSGDLKNSSSVADSLHAWVEAYVPGIGWMTLDPTWGEKFDEFGHSDLDHFAFAVWGEHDELPAPTMSGNLDLGYQYEQALLSYKSTVSTTSPAGHLQINRLVLLPFVTLDRVTAVAEAQVASDNNVVTINGARVALGSLAPSQSSRVWRLNLGSGWNVKANGQFIQEGTDTLVLASSTSGPNYLPMIFILLAGVGGGTWGVIRLRKVRGPSIEITAESDH